MATRLPDARRNGVVASVVDALDAGPDEGFVEIRTGAQPADADDAATGTLLATVPLGDPAFAAEAAGSAAANAIAPQPAVATGVAGWYRAFDSTGAAVLDGAITAEGGGGDMELNSVNLELNVDFDITTWTVTAPAST